MKRFLLLLTGLGTLALHASAQVETWNLDPNHSAAHFAVRHMGISTVRGAFSKLSGTVQYDPAHPEQTAIDVTIDANSVDTRVEMRDKDLRSPNFFDVEKYPTITFKSKKVETAGAGKLNITGDLTIHGVTKEVVLHVVCFGRFWVRDLPFPNARHLGHPLQWKNTLCPATKVRILRFKDLPPFRHDRGLQNHV